MLPKTSRMFKIAVNVFTTGKNILQQVYVF